MHDVLDVDDEDEDEHDEDEDDDEHDEDDEDEEEDEQDEGDEDEEQEGSFFEIARRLRLCPPFSFSAPSVFLSVLSFLPLLSGTALDFFLFGPLVSLPPLSFLLLLSLLLLLSPTFPWLAVAPATLS